MANNGTSIMGLVRLVRDNSKQIPFYVVKGLFYCKSGESLMISGAVPEDYRRWGFNLNNWTGFLQRQLEKELGKLLYRSVSGEKLEQILKTGSDIPQQGVNDTTYVTFELDKALEYGYPTTQEKCLLQQDICVILYDPLGLRTNRGNYQAVFLKNPATVLRGILLTKPDTP